MTAEPRVVTAYLGWLGYPVRVFELPDWDNTDPAEAVRQGKDINFTRTATDARKSRLNRQSEAIRMAKVHHQCRMDACDSQVQGPIVMERPTSEHHPRLWGL